MIKRLLIAVVISLTAVSCSDKAAEYPFTIAHRGCWMSDVAQFTQAESFVVPENSLEAVRMAALYGYKAIEIDPRFTSDSVIVVMHDGLINRTMRLAGDNSVIPDKVRVSECSFDELRTAYEFQSSDPKMRSRIPTLRELVTECRDCGVMPLVHCDFFEAYPTVQEIVGDDFIAFGEEFETFRKVREISPCKILLDPSRELRKRGLEENPACILALLDELGGDTGISSMKHSLCSKEICDALKAAGHDVQSSIFSTPHELEAVRNGATILLSDFCWKPSKGMKPAGEFSRKVCDSLQWRGSSTEYGALVLEMAGCGQWEVEVNGERSYSISRTTPGTETVSCRYYDREASVRIRVTSGEGVDVKVSNYAFGNDQINHK